MTDPSRSVGADYLADALAMFRQYKALAERAVAQVTDEQFFAAIDGENNTIAITLRHVAGNQRSRWTDFLTTDGEKPDRDRDQEFENPGDRSRRDVMREWEDGWKLLFETIEALGPSDLSKTVQIRRQPHTVVQAINRQLCHYAYHVGQVVFLARHWAGPSWSSLSIPRGKSAEYLAR